MSKKNIFIKKISNLLLSINDKIESFFNSLQQKKFDKKKYFAFWKKPLDKKIFIYSGVLFFSVIIYFLMPAFYDKDKIKDQIKNQILQSYNFDVKLDKDPKYVLFPKPHFLVEEVKIEYDTKIISNSKYVKFYISSKNNFKFNTIKIKNLIFFKTDFRIDKSDFHFFSKLLNNRILSQNINFIKSKIFYLDQNEDIIFFSDVKKLDILYQENLLNKMNARLDIFNIPIKLGISHDIFNKNILTNIKVNKLKLNIENDLKYTDQSLDGIFELNYISKNQTINYKLKNNSLNFSTIDKNINGKINIKPFFLSSNVNLKNFKIKNFFEKNSILVNLLKTQIFNNENLNSKISVTIDGISDTSHISLIKFDVVLEEGLILISNLSFNFKDSAIFEFKNVNLNVDDNQLIFIGDLDVDFKKIQKFYNHFQILRNNRTNIDRIVSSFVFNLDKELFEFNELKIINANNQISDVYLNNFVSKEIDFFNKIIFRNTVRKFFEKISLD